MKMVPDYVHPVFKIPSSRLTYIPEHGRSRFSFRCNCGERQEVYVWSGKRKCQTCNVLLLLLLGSIEEVVGCPYIPADEEGKKR
jgi:hypothetical protein